MSVPMISITSNSLPFLSLIQLNHAIFQVAEVSFQTVEINSENKNKVIQTTPCIWMQEGKRAAQISILVTIHLPPLEYGKIEDQKFGTKLISRVNVNSSFIGMDCKAVAPWFSCLLSLHTLRRNCKIIGIGQQGWMKQENTFPHTYVHRWKKYVVGIER